MEYKVVLKSLPEKIVFTRKIVVKDCMQYDTELYCCGEECTAINVTNGIHPDLDLPPRKYRYCFVKHLDGKFTPTNQNLEFVEALNFYGNSSENIRMGKLDAVPVAACLYHEGPRNTMGETFDKLYKWIEDAGLEVAGVPREVFIANISSPEKPNWVIDEIQIPIKCVKFFNMVQDPAAPNDDDPEAAKWEKA